MYYVLIHHTKGILIMLLYAKVWILCVHTHLDDFAWLQTSMLRIYFLLLAFSHTPLGFLCVRSCNLHSTRSPYRELLISSSLLHWDMPMHLYRHKYSLGFCPLLLVVFNFPWPQNLICLCLVLPVNWLSSCFLDIHACGETVDQVQHFRPLSAAVVFSLCLNLLCSLWKSWWCWRIWI